MNFSTSESIAMSPPLLPSWPGHPLPLAVELALFDRDAAQAVAVGVEDHRLTIGRHIDLDDGIEQQPLLVNVLVNRAVEMPEAYLVRRVQPGAYADHAGGQGNSGEQQGGGGEQSSLGGHFGSPYLLIRPASL